MVTLVTGGSGSGKSEYAEGLLLDCKDCTRYYVATMEAWGEEGKARVLRHRRLREGKGFITIEQPRQIGTITFPAEERNTAEEKNTAEAGNVPEARMASEEKMASGIKRAVLLECISNLAANEMFGPAGIREPEALADYIEKETALLSARVHDLILVTNEISEEGIVYEAETMDYIRLMGLVNQRLAAMADRVAEVIYGIPVIWKEGRNL